MTQRSLALGLSCMIAPLLLAAPASAALEECTNGTAGIFSCSGVDLYAQLPLAAIGGGNGNDVWGWTDPVDGSEYALVGRTNGIAFVDVTDPENPVYLGNLPTQTTSSSWRDIKVYQNHAYVVADSVGSHGMQIFDLTQLRNVANPPVTFAPTGLYTQFGSAHNIVINEASGFAYAVDSGTCSNGLHMIDLNVDPVNPTFAGCHSAEGTIHDAQCVNYIGPDPDHQGKEICFTATLTGVDSMDIIDVTNKAATVRLSTNTYPGATTAHQGWLTPDHQYFLHGDEGDETSFGHGTRTHIFDVRDLDNPIYLGDYTAALASIDHNLYTLGDHVYEANYTSGLRILDTTDVANANLTEVAFFDTRPESDAAGFQGAWSNYPFFASCTALVSDIQRGLFVLRPSTKCECGNGVIEPGEDCDGGNLGGVTCGDLGCTGGTLTCTPQCTFDLATCTGCGLCDFDGVCEPGEDCDGCPTDCISGSSPGAVCGNGVCDAGDGEDCLSCPADCAGRQKGKASNRYCCGDGAGENPVTCSDPRCTADGLACSEVPATPIDFCCGDLVCEGDEDVANCALDCDDGGGGSCLKGQPGDACVDDADCCSGNCKGKPGSRTCK